MDEEKKTIDVKVLRTLRHDIKNQLSGMILCVEQLKFELSGAPPDQEYYLRSIGEGCENIDRFLENIELPE